MSEYQYYEFQAIDRAAQRGGQVGPAKPVDAGADHSHKFHLNHYNWSDFKGNPRQLMERWFDLHLYLADWGTRRLMIRLPKRLVDRSRLNAFLHEVNLLEIRDSGENLIVDMSVDLYGDELPEYDEWEEWG